jgi:hypothetical protein
MIRNNANKIIGSWEAIIRRKEKEEIEGGGSRGRGRGGWLSKLHCVLPGRRSKELWKEC